MANTQSKLQCIKREWPSGTRCEKHFSKPALSEYRENMVCFWMRYCPEHRFDGKEHPVIAGVPARS